MTLAEIITRLQDVYGNTLSSSDAYYGRVVNDAYFKICALTEWWWLEKDQVIVANAPATSFVASATIASTAMIISGSIATTYGANTWIGAPERVYRATSISGSATVTLTLDSPWIETTNTAVAVDLWGDTFTLPTDFDTVVSVASRSDDNYKPLTQVTLADIETYGSNVFDWASEVADRFCVYPNPDGTASSKTQLIRIFPPPDETTEYLLRYRMCPATLSAAADVPFLPERYHPILVDYAKLELYKNEGEDSDRIQFAEQEASKGMAMLIRQNSQRGNVNRRFGRRGIVASVAVTPVKFLNTTGAV